MPSQIETRRRRGNPPVRRVHPCLSELEQRVVLSFPGITGITIDTSGDVFVSYNSTGFFTGQQQSIAELTPNGGSANVLTTTGSLAKPGMLTTVGTTATLPNISDASEILELEPSGEIFAYDPNTGTQSQYDDLANYTPNASKVYDVQTGSSVNLSSDINLADATFGDFGVYQNSLVIAAESNDWDFVMRLTYGSSANVATVLVASPASDGLSASPEGVAVDSQGTVLTTLPYVPAGSTSAIHVPVGFSLFYDTGSSPQPSIPSLGLTQIPNIESSGITVDPENNFILAATNSALYGSGPGIVHINSALTAFLADPTSASEGTPDGIALQDVDGTTYLAFTEPGFDTYTVAGELPLFSGQVSPEQLRNAYGVNQITFTGPNGTTVTGDGSGQTIAIVEEGVDPTLESDLHTFDQYFGIPDPPSFQVVYQNGVTTQNDTIVGEASLDVEWAHAIAPGASIVVYDAAYEPSNTTASYLNLLQAMQQASKLPGVSVVTLSYGGPEAGVSATGETPQELDAGFTTPGVTFLAASGDHGAYGNGGFSLEVDYPAASPNVVAVGGTSVVFDAAGDYPGTGTTGEVGWGDGTQSGGKNGSGSGGGLSTVETEPSWQEGVVPTTIDGVNARAVPDVAMDSGSAQEYDVFTSTLAASSDSAAAVGWLGDAGTSAASPIWAGLIAIADQGRALAGGTPLTGYDQTLPALYSLPSADFHDIVSGNNGYPAGTGYDLVTGLGTPVANLLVPDLAAYEIPAKLTISTQPPSSVVAGHTFGFTVQVADKFGNPITGGTVTVALVGNTGAALGGTLTEPVENGLATFSGLSLSAPGTNYVLSVTDNGMSGSQTTDPISAMSVNDVTRIEVSAIPAASAVGESVLISATVNVVSPGTGTPSGTVTFDLGSTVLGTSTLVNGVATLTTIPTTAGTETISIAFSGDVSDQPVSTEFSLPVAPASPTPTPTPSPTPTPTPAAAMILSEHPVFQRKLNKKGKPVGKAVLTGFTFDFNTPVSAIAAADEANYQLDTVTTKRVKKTDVRILHPVTRFTVSYTSGSDVLSVNLTGARRFRREARSRFSLASRAASGARSSARPRS